MPHPQSLSLQPSSMAELTAVPQGLVRAKNPLARKRASKNRTGKTRNGPRNSSNTTVGNDTRVPWLSRPKSLHTIHLSQALEESTFITSSSTVPVFSSILFNISTISNFLSLAAVFDEYRILEIEVLITPNVTEIINGLNAGSYITAVDIDDSSIPTSQAQLASYETSIDSKATVSHYHRWVPQFAVAAYAGAFTSYSMMTGWLDCNSPNIQHYGIKFGVTVSSVTQEFTYQYRYRCAFRGVH